MTPNLRYVKSNSLREDECQKLSLSNEELLKYIRFAEEQSGTTNMKKNIASSRQYEILNTVNN